ncbi:MAG: 4-hydroxy-tetrahydrodipicolinate synthase [Ruminococcaceae bacterium]|nr:4-hydroxy-tetrahydrodipicolinate synthase [Oscillospiraceae bacterium]
MSKPIIFEGAGVAIATPMYADGSVNFDVLAQMIDFQIKNQTDAIIVCGTTGEAKTMNTDEHIKVIKFVVDEVAGKVPVIAGAGSNDTAYGVALAEDAVACGADALLLVTPYYNKTSQEGLIHHFNYIADRAKKPIILYNVPSRTGLNILPETYAELAKHPMIVASKEANGDISALAKSIELCGENLHFYSGNDDQTTAFMALGAKGVISVLSNIMPREAHNIAQAALDGDFKKSAALQIKYLDMCNTLFCDVNPIPVKRALNLMRFEAGECRMPLYHLSETNEKMLISCMRKYNLID